MENILEYKKFVQLVTEGEKKNVDFKIRCDAFQPDSRGGRLKDFNHKAELAKDICAMSNNGYITSYIIVGVSDDRRKFLSCDNPKLTDENLQSFCKSAIHPPPKVKVLRKEWRSASPEHAKKEFVIIQIGPQRRQAFRLARDFIDYNQKFCYRRNDVWIRRGTTSDLATPEEVSDLVQGKKIDISPVDEERKKEKNDFSKMALIHRLTLIEEKTRNLLLELDFQELPPSNKYDGNYNFLPRINYQRFASNIGLHRDYELLHYWKINKKTLLIVSPYKCYEKIVAKELWDIQSISIKHDFYKKAEHKYIDKFIEFPYGSVRRVALLTSINTVPGKRIESIFTTWSKTNIPYHYFKNSLYLRPNKVGEVLPTSSELLFIPDIKSSLEYIEVLSERLKQIELLDEPIIRPRVRAK